MASRPEPLNAILYAQYHLKGGAKNTLIGMGVGLLAVGGTSVLSLTLDPRHTRDAARVAMTLILAVQWLVLGLYGTSRVSGAVRQDINGGLIESHRLTPADAMGAAVGYVLGPPVQAIALAVVMLGVGLAMALVAQVSVVYWLAANGMTLAAALTAWTLVALIAFTANSAAVLPLVVITLIASAGLFAVVPAMSVLSAPLLGRSVFTITQTLPTLPEAYVYTLVGEALLCGVMLLAIARRYRNADTPAFSIRLGLVLLAIWTALTLVGLAQVELFVSRVFRSDSASPMRLIAGLASTFLLALVPLTAIARDLARPADGSAVAGRAWREVPAWALVVVCAVVACLPAMMVYATPGLPLVIRPMGTLAVAVAMFAGLTLTLAWRFMAGKSGWLLTFLFILLPNAIPPLVDASIRAESYGASTTWITGFSPLGSLIMLWGRTPYDALPGLVGQATYAVLPLILYVISRVSRPAGGRGFAVEPAAA